MNDFGLVCQPDQGQIPKQVRLGGFFVLKVSSLRTRLSVLPLCTQRTQLSLAPRLPQSSPPLSCLEKNIKRAERVN